MSNENIYNTECIIEDSEFGEGKAATLTTRQKNELSTHYVMRTIQKSLAAKGIKVDFYDLQFDDGYFIFYKGESGVAQFKIKQAPGWLFGLWWNDKVSDTHNQGELFAQYEEIIDKFKPTRSAFCSSCIGTTEKVPYDEGTLYTEMVEFIIKEPYLAFYRDYTGEDYNYKYITRKEAKKAYIKWQNEAAQEQKNKDKLNHKVYSLLRRNIKNFKLIDNGEDCFPRYMLYLLDAGDESVVNRGNVVDLLPPRAAKKYEKFNDCGIHGMYDIGDWYYVVPHDEYEKLTDTKL